MAIYGWFGCCVLFPSPLLIRRQLKWLMRRFSTSQYIHKQNDTFTGTRAQPEHNALCIEMLLYFFCLCVPVFAYGCTICTHECVCVYLVYKEVISSSMSHRVEIKAWDDPFLNEQTLHFDRSLTRHYLSLGASALLIQHP